MSNSLDVREIMYRAKDAGFEFFDSNAPGEAVEKVCLQMGIPCLDSDGVLDKALEIQDRLNQMEASK